MSTVFPSLTPAEAHILDALHAHNYSPDCLHALGLSASDILAWSSSPAVAAALSALRHTLAALAHLSDLSRSHAARPLALDALSSVIATSDNLTQRRLAATSLLRTTSPPSPRPRGEAKMRGSVPTKPHPPAIPSHPCERAAQASASSPACATPQARRVTQGSESVTEGVIELACIPITPTSPPPTPDAGPEKALRQRSGHEGTPSPRPSKAAVPANAPPRPPVPGERAARASASSPACASPRAETADPAHTSPHRTTPGRDAPAITPFPPRHTHKPVATLLARAGAPARPP